MPIRRNNPPDRIFEVAGVVQSADGFYRLDTGEFLGNPQLHGPPSEISIARDKYIRGEIEVEVFEAVLDRHLSDGTL